MNENRSNVSDDRNQCDSVDCSCNSNTDLNRRKFLSLTMYGAAGAMVSSSGLGVMAGPFAENENLSTIPVDKKLSAEWIKSLFERGKPEFYTSDRDELKYIGMPVGGVCCGQLYLGGDGSLWLWDIFQSRYQSDYGGMSMGKNYAHPHQPDKVNQPQPQKKPEQGFALRIESEGQTQIRPLSQKGFGDISFRGEYPVGRVSYRDPDCPIDVDLEAFSPFIPLEPEDSALPATVMSYTLKNSGNSTVEITLAGWLENTVCLDCQDASLGMRRNQVIKATNRLTLSCLAEPLPAEVQGKALPDEIFADFEGDDTDIKATDFKLECIGICILGGTAKRVFELGGGFYV
jgi:non-lysosomal glucosylceramidase